MNAARHRNMFPQKGGISPHFSSHTLIGDGPLVYGKHFIADLGYYVLAGHEETIYNTLAPRAIEAIYLSPDYSPQGGHILMDLNTGRELKPAEVGTSKLSQLLRLSSKQSKPWLKGRALNL